jgi:hypothetical protein
MKQGAMLNLNELNIGFCPMLKELRDQSSNLWASIQIVLDFMPNEFIENVEAKHPNSLIIKNRWN